LVWFSYFDRVESGGVFIFDSQTGTGTTFQGTTAVTATTETNIQLSNIIYARNNYGIHSVGGNSHAIWGVSATGVGVRGDGENHYGGYFSSNSGDGARGTSIYGNGLVGVSSQQSGVRAYTSSSIGYPALRADNTNGDTFLSLYVKGTSTLTGTLTVPAITIGLTPTTSAGTYDMLTRNTSTGVVEKVASTSLSQWTTTANDIQNNNTGNVIVKPLTKFQILTPAGGESAYIEPIFGNFINKTNTGGFLMNDAGTGMVNGGAANLFFHAYGTTGSMFSFIPKQASNLTGNLNVINESHTVNPTSGTGTTKFINITPTINQTGGANGVIHGIYIAPTLTSAPDFRAIEVVAGNSIFQKVIANGVVRLKNYTVATLPAGTQGDTAYVTDALDPSYLVTVVGGGSVATAVFYNGTAWVSH